MKRGGKNRNEITDTSTSAKAIGLREYGYEALVLLSDAMHASCTMQYGALRYVVIKHDVGHGS